MTPVEAILQKARTTPCSRKGIADLAAELDGDTLILDGAVRTAAEGGEPMAGALLAMAARTAGHRIDAAAIGALLPRVSNIQCVPILVGCARGDRIGMLVDQVESGHLAWERQALALLLAVELLEGEPPPAKVLAHLRTLARKQLSDTAGMLVGLAVNQLDDSGVRRVASKWIAFALLGSARQMHGKLRAMLREEPVETFRPLDEAEGTEGGPVRSSRKVGRNEPCPCGSGRKYKRCCQKKQRDEPDGPAGKSSRVMTAEELDNRPGYLPGESGVGLRPQMIEALDFEKLSSMELIDALRMASQYCLWEQAEAAMEVLENRRDLPAGGDPDGWREELILDAIRAREVDLVQRQVALLRDEELRDSLQVRLILLQPGPKTLDTLEETAVQGLRESEGSTLIDLAHALLEHHPALGVLVGRAAIDPDRVLDSVTLLEAIEEARDRLGLAPGDLAEEIYDHLMDDRYEEGTASDKRSEELAAEREEQRKQLERYGREVEDLRKELRAKEEQLRLFTEEHLERGLASPAGNPSEQDQESRIQRLREKIEEFKSRVTSVQQERRDLRRQLAHLAQKSRPRSVPAGSPEPPDGDADALEVEARRPGRRRVLFPEFSHRARSSIDALQPRLARKTMAVVCALCAGDPSAWNEVKKLQAVEDIWRARVGLSHRLLFTLGEESGVLTVVDVVPRKGLETAVRQLG